MRIGLFLGPLDTFRSIADQLRSLEDAEQDGFDSFWFPQQFGADVLTIIAIAGQRTNRIEIGTAVVPTFPRHPVVLAQQALTAQVATGGRLTLGVGVSHQSTIEDWLGLSYDRPALHMKEYLSVLRPLLNEEGVDFAGEMFEVSGALQIPDALPCPVVVAALGPRMLSVAGELGDGTVTWMTGPRGLAQYVVPRLNEAAASAGRPMPRVCVGPWDIDPRRRHRQPRPGAGPGGPDLPRIRIPSQLPSNAGAGGRVGPWRHRHTWQRSSR